MNLKLCERVLETIRRHRMVQAGDRVAVGVSGGADSVGLLLVLGELREELGISLLVAHYNHHLRGEESDGDERFVRELAAAQGLECIVGEGDVGGEARRQRRNVEDVGRRMRYGFLEGLVEAGRASKVAVGHTADDQAETVLGRILRGCGPAGLAGIYAVRGAIIRPLLEVRRREVREALEAAGQTWREDATNFDRKRLRARIRQELIPYLEREFQAELVEHLCELAAIAQGEEAHWRKQVEEWMKLHARREGGVVMVEAAELAGGRERQDRALARRVVRAIYEECRRGSGHLSAKHVEAVVRLAECGQTGQRVELPGRVEAEKRAGEVEFRAREERGEEEGETGGGSGSYQYVVELPADGSVTVEVKEIRKRLGVKVFDWPTEARDTMDSGQALDRDSLSPPLVIRNWQPGDAYRPAGRRGVRKLKRLFQESGIRAEERKSWPVLTSAGRVVWVLGLPVEQEVAASGTTRKAVVIAEEPK